MAINGVEAVGVETVNGRGPQLPTPRGALSELLIATLSDPPPAHDEAGGPLAGQAGDGALGEDFQLSLYLLYELHYRGFAGVDEDWEWQPSLLGLRSALEADFEATLRELVAAPDPPAADRIGGEIMRMVEADDPPALSSYMERSASLEQFREFLVHRSAYQLKEADPHSWAIPRLHGPAKAALVEVQADEYGGGRSDRVHATLFAKAMRALDLDPAYGAYLD